MQNSKNVSQTRELLDSSFRGAKHIYRISKSFRHQALKQGFLAGRGERLAGGPGFVGRLPQQLAVKRAVQHGLPPEPAAWRQPPLLGKDRR